LNNLYQEISSQPSPTLVLSAAKELGVASEQLQVGAKLIHQQHEQLLLAKQAIRLARDRNRELLEFIPAACLFTDGSGKIHAANRAAGSLLNQPTASTSRIDTRNPLSTARGRPLAQLTTVFKAGSWATRPRRYSTKRSLHPCRSSGNLLHYKSDDHSLNQPASATKQADHRCKTSFYS
jgi:PAS domain-containing protein